MIAELITLVVACAALHAPPANAHKIYQAQIPNGNRVPNPCEPGAIWYGVGHQSPAGANARNPFGMDFKAAGFKWTADLCRMDSDGDGRTNGQELGDPDCVWTPGAIPAMTTGLSHPGICPLDSTSCIDSWTVCPKAFNCPALSEPGVVVRNLTINKNTPIPVKESTTICQAFELNSTATPVHMIGSRPIIVNGAILHHMSSYACSVRPEQAMFDGPHECFMGSFKGCTEMLNLWTYGSEGECFNSNAGFRLGGIGYRFAILELHWKNPKLIAGLTDSSGFALYITAKLRMHDQGKLMYGEGNLVLPPRQPVINVNHTCPSVCTNLFHSETRYITSAMIHMHTHGFKGRISLWRNGILIKVLSPLQEYDYNSPKMVMLDPAVEYRRGDEVKTECYFNTMRSNNSIFNPDEMCISFLSYYPNNHAVSLYLKLSQCFAHSGINLCWWLSGITPHIEGDCNITAMRTGVMPTQVLREMTANKCFYSVGCHPACRNYLNNTLWPSNACYDPKRSRLMAESMAANNPYNTYPANATIISTLYGQRFCEQEINMLAEMDRKAAAAAATTPAPTALPAAQPTSEMTCKHLLSHHRMGLPWLHPYFGRISRDYQRLGVRLCWCAKRTKLRPASKHTRHRTMKRSGRRFDYNSLT